MNYQTGNLFELIPVNGATKVIPHICNNVGAWGAGFVIPLAKYCPESRQAYLQWYKSQYDIERQIPFELGQVQLVRSAYRADTVIVANMIAQEGVQGVGRPTNDPNPIRYAALAQCLKKVKELDDNVLGEVEIHAPKFGSGLAGGNWDFIAELIKEIWAGMDVTIYSLEETPCEIKI